MNVRAEPLFRDVEAHYVVVIVPFIKLFHKYGFSRFMKVFKSLMNIPHIWVKIGHFRPKIGLFWGIFSLFWDL